MCETQYDLRGIYTGWTPLSIRVLMVFTAVPDYVMVCTGRVPDGTYAGNVSGPGNHPMFRR